jgi:hypothetical protein
VLSDKWKKSTRSGSGGDCVEVRLAPGSDGTAVQFRDSKDPDGPVLTIPRGAFADLVALVNGDELA